MTPIDHTAARPPDPTTTAAMADLRKTVNEVIGSVFFGPLLRSLRAGSLKGEIGHGGRGEEVFQAQLDQVFAERAGAATRYELGDALVERFAPAAIAYRKGTKT